MNLDLNPMTNQTIMLIANVIVGCAIAYICMCRLNMTTTATRKLVRLKYTLLTSGSLTLAGLPFLFQVHHNIVTLFAGILVFILIALEVRQWRHGPPLATIRQDHRSLQ